VNRCKRDPYYTSQGIKVCQRWRKFVNFLEDMGERPNGKELDRYPDVLGDYEPGNVRWSTKSSNMLNREKWVWKKWARS
jgi:hypothetical protein